MTTEDVYQLVLFIICNTKSSYWKSGALSTHVKQLRKSSGIQMD